MDYKIIEQDERYFCGIEHYQEIVYGEQSDIYLSWQKMFSDTYNKIKLKTTPHQMIGLNCYDVDFDETNMSAYYALCETIDLIKQDDTLVTKKLPKGRYICFKIQYDSLGSERKKAYEYCKKNNIKIHEGFDYEHFLNENNYEQPNAVLELCLMLEDD